MSGWVAGAVVVGSVIQGSMSSNAAENAANTQAAASGDAAAAQLQATRESIAAQERAFERQVALQEPFREAGMKGQNELMRLLGLSGDVNAKDYGTLARSFTGQDMYKDPGYDFRLKEGIKALDRSAAARGGLLSGNQLRGVTQFGQDYATNEYQNAFNRYQAERAARLNPLQSLSGQAQSTANTLTNAAGTLGSGESAALMAGGNAAAAGLIGAGNARASGYVGGANAWGNTIGNITNAYVGYKQNQQQNALLDRYLSGNRGYGGGGGYSSPYSVGNFDTLSNFG